MSKKDKLLKELENNPTNVRFEILEKLLLDNGFGQVANHSTVS